MSYDSNKYQDSEGVYPPPPPSCPPPVQGYYEAGPYVEPPRVSDLMKYGPQHLQQPPPPPPPNNPQDVAAASRTCALKDYE